MKRFRTFGYCVKQGFIGLWRNRTFSFASVATIIVCLIILGVFYFTFININHALSDVGDSVAISVFFDDEVSEDEILKIRSRVTSIEGTEAVFYISAEEAWRRYKLENLTPEIAESFGDDNPLKHSASLEVHLDDNSKQRTVAEEIKQIKGVRTVNYSEVVLEKMAEIRTIAMIVSGTLVAMLAAVACFLVRNTIMTGINVRKGEISIMSLIGATDFFMILPFAVEGIVIGVLGGVIPIAFLAIAYDKVQSALMNQFSAVFTDFSLISRAEAMDAFIPVAFPFSVGIGLVTSWLTAKVKIRKIAVEHF